jgi:hypothetical protein
MEMEQQQLEPPMDAVDAQARAARSACGAQENDSMVEHMNRQPHRQPSLIVLQSSYESGSCYKSHHWASVKRGEGACIEC